MGSSSVWHWCLVLAVFILLFGSDRISRLLRGIGEGMQDFRKSLKREAEEIATAMPTKSELEQSVSKGLEDPAI
ncbi:twin-arginine translocase TatA/TatE family subunit [Rhizobium leguminosarum]|uniref:twin-arginine translocase TatA/TatE family subunit n=1 Tax=Rhizobium leguminosarum TaxID=384 RepID=UPI003F988B99